MIQRFSVTLITLGVVLIAAAVGLVLFLRSAPTELDASTRDSSHQAGPPLALPNPHTEDGPLVFEQREVNLGPVKEPVRHRFTFTNQGSQPIRIKRVTASCTCTLTKTERETYGPNESGSITLEVDITKREPGPHRFSITVEYESPQSHIARASILAYYQPDLPIIPKVVDLSVTERNTATAGFALIDYRPEPLKLKGFRVSSPALQVRLAEKPGEYLPGWKYTFEVGYTDSPGQKQSQIAEAILIETSDPTHATIKVPVIIRRLERLRVAPKLVRLASDGDGRKLSGKVMIRDMLGKGVEIDSVSTGGLVEVSYDRKPESTKLLTITLPKGPVDPAKFPTTITIKVKQPWTKDITLAIDLARTGRS